LRSPRDADPGNHPPGLLAVAAKGVEVPGVAESTRRSGVNAFRNQAGGAQLASNGFGEVKTRFPVQILPFREDRLEP